MKSAATIAALAALGLVAVNYSASEGSQLFLSERLAEEEMAYMRYVTEYGKSYGTKAEFEFRFEQFKKTLVKMANHNSQNEHQSTVGHNQFSDFRVDTLRLGSDRYQDMVFPMMEKAYRDHTVCFGLFFRKVEVERAVLDAYARLHCRVVYLGYFLFLCILGLNFLYGYVDTLLQIDLCNKSVDSGGDLCIVFYGESAAISTPSLPLSYQDIARHSLYAMTPACIAVVVVLLILGSLSHWWIHRSPKVREKSWSMLSAWVIHVLILVAVDLDLFLGVLLDQSSESNSQWSWGLGMMMVIQSTLIVFFSTAPWLLILLWMAIATLLYAGFSVPILMQDQRLAFDSAEEDTTPIFTTIFYISWTTYLSFYAITLLIGSCYSEVTARKRFLQRVLLHKQQAQIIREKTKNENLQRQFLENVLPPSLVDDFHKQQRLSSQLSNSHVGVSMLYADLVDFTAFSARVDPFEVMVFLNDLFRVFDNMCDEYNVHKLETVGDCYVATVGVVTGDIVVIPKDRDRDRDREEKVLDQFVVENASCANAQSLVGFAKAMVRGSRRVRKPYLKNSPAIMRVGIHVGPCISGIVGTKKLKFCLLGDTVVRAAQMEKRGVSDCIHVSQEVSGRVPGEPWRERLGTGGESRGYLLSVD
jgi:class 3 adenylate cyclase